VISLRCLVLISHASSIHLGAQQRDTVLGRMNAITPPIEASVERSRLGEVLIVVEMRRVLCQLHRGASPVEIGRWVTRSRSRSSPLSSWNGREVALPLTMTQRDSCNDRGSITYRPSSEVEAYEAISRRKLERGIEPGLASKHEAIDTGRRPNTDLQSIQLGLDIFLGLSRYLRAFFNTRAVVVET
jgi:hypothetical protein